MSYQELWDDVDDRAWPVEGSEHALIMRAEQKVLKDKMTVDISHLTPATLHEQNNPTDINTPQSKAIDSSRSCLFNAIKLYGLASQMLGEERATKEWKAVKRAILNLEITVEDMTAEVVESELLDSSTQFPPDEHF